MIRSPAADAPPLSEMNTTPLIDVMLVLLIMFIVTIPLQTHAVKLDLPDGPPPRAVVDKTRNMIVVTASRELLWNGAPLSMPELRLHLAAVGQMPVQPEVNLRPDAEARYDLVDSVLAETKRAQVTRLGFVGNERYARF